MTTTLRNFWTSCAVIRSAAHPPMDENSPEDIFSLGDYLAREQYGSRPLLYGQAYSSEIKYRLDNSTSYWEPVFTVKGKAYGRQEKKSADEKDRYYVMDEKREYKYAQNMLFPRMYSPESDHVREYISWCNGIKGRTYNHYDIFSGKNKKVTIPTQAENLKFFIRYQVNFMYWRYFLWNFAGRQNDIQNHYGEPENGNWITGFKFIDRKLTAGDPDLLPDSLKGKGHNVFYCMPLILGLIGLLWQVGKGKQGTQQFFVVLTLFFMTGLAIVVYLNQTPLQPRERDYAYAGSFYAYAIWIGIGVAAISEWLGKIAGKKAAPVIAALICLIIPLQMVSQTWDDHDRSGRYTCRDFGQNYLISLQEKGYPIIFTNGDNDTFPLWYNFETEGFRTDARCCNLSYLMTDWYIDQMKRPAYNSPALPISFERIDYQTGTNDAVPIKLDAKQKLLSSNPKDVVDKSFELHNVLDYWIKQHGVIPTDTIWLKIDKDAVLRSGMKIPDQYLGATDEETKAKMPDRMVISLKGKSRLYKNEIMMLDLIAHCNWERPLYMATTVTSSSYMNLENFFLLEGLAYRITPFEWGKFNSNPIDTDKMYANLMNYKFGGADNPDLYLDETVRRMCISHRRLFTQLASQLIDEGKNDKALELLNKIDKGISSEALPQNDWYNVETANLYLMLGQVEKGGRMLTDIADNMMSTLCWYLSMNNRNLKLSQAQFRETTKRMDTFVMPMLSYCLEDKTFESLQKDYKTICDQFESRVK